MDQDAGAPMPGGSRGSEVVTVVTPLEDSWRCWFPGVTDRLLHSCRTQEAQLPIFMTGEPCLQKQSCSDTFQSPDSIPELF